MSEGHFEAKVERRSENAKGIFITLLVNPADHDEALSQVRVGSALQIGWAEIVDTSVQPIEVSEPVELRIEQAAYNRQVEGSNPSPRTKTPFKDMSLPQQAGIRCGDPQFQQFLLDAKGARWGSGGNAAADATSFVRAHCGVKSRADLSTDRAAANIWRALESDFQAYLTTKQYEGVAR